MAAAAGSLVVSLGLDAAQYTSGLTKAEYQARQFGETIGKGIRDAATLAGAALAGLGVSATAAYAAFTGLIKGAGDFQDLAEKTGASAEGLASFGVAAGTAGTSVDAIAQASVRLTKNLTGVDDESKAAGAALDALGINIADFKALAPERQIEVVSKALAGFADGSGKTAVALALIPKSGAELLPFFKALAEQGGRQVILTAEQIRQADDYTDAQARTRAQITQYAQALATQAIPAIQAFTGALVDTAKEMFGVGQGASALGSNTGVQSFAESAVRSLGFVIDSADGVKRTFEALGKFIGGYGAASAALLKGDIAGAREIGSAFREDIGKTLEAPLFSQALAKRLAEAKAAAAAGPTAGPVLPALKFGGAQKGGGRAGSKDDPTKKELDNALKLLENAVQQEEDLLRSRNRILDLYNGENLISTVDYWAGKRVAQEDAVAKQIALYDQEIAALQAYQAKAGKATEREAAQGKINTLIEKKQRLTREAGETAIEWGFKERKALEDLERQMNAVNAEVLELTGNLGEATRIRVGDQFKDLSQRLGANGDTAGLAQVARLKQLKIAQADYGQQAEEVTRITEGLRIQEERIALARQLGTTGELESLVKIGEARRGAVEQMRSMVEAQEAIARASGNPALVQAAERARLELEKLAATINPLADKFNTLFADAAGSAFADFINGTKTAQQAFKSFTDTIFRELTNLIVKDLFKQLFSGGEGGGGLNIGSLLAGFLGGGKAAGGSIMPNSLQRVNEQGPELLDVNGKQYLMNGNRNARITPYGSFGGGTAVTINQSFASGTTRETTNQAALAASRVIQRAQRNA